MHQVTDAMRDTWVQTTRAHQDAVRLNINVIRLALLDRAIRHDASKLQEPELSGYAAFQERLNGVTYGTDAYRLALQEAAPFIQHHYQENDHHPEHFPGGMEEMNLLQLLEMLADWKAAAARSPNGSLAQSFAVNRERFGDSLILRQLERTAKELGWLDD